jgi:hypothetical protein
MNVSNDLTKTERAREKELWEEAKKMNDKDDSGDFKCKMGQESNSASAGLYRFSFGLTSVIPMMFGLLSLGLAMSSSILLNNWSAFV